MRHSNVSSLVGGCVTPFFDASLFGDNGYLDGRFCAPVYELPGIPICCLPCPATDWAYSDQFATYSVVAEWLNVIGLILIAFMLLTYVVLPTQQTRSHYLSVCLIVSIAMIALGFIIPLAAQPDQCYDEITPNDMFTSMECAWSGALIIAGGLCVVTWIFVRALSMNLQICWDIVPGKKFFYASQLLGWGTPAVLFTIVITLTGVSFRFGNACHVNHTDSMGDFWGPLLSLAGAAGILQLMTFAYCAHVYLRNLWSDQPDASSNASGSGLPSNSKTGPRPRAVYRRLKKVLWLQWRGICIVTIILVDVVFFSVVFVYMDGMQNNIVNDASKWVKVKPWLVCLAEFQGDKQQCLHLVQSWLIGEPVITAVLFLLSLAGVQVFLLLTRPTVFPAWWRLIKSKCTSPQEFISRDARPEVMRSNSKRELLPGPREPSPPATFELQPKGTYIVTSELDLKGVNSILSSPEETYKSPLQGEYDSPATDTTYESLRSMSPPLRGRLPPEYVGRITPSPALENAPHSKSFAYARANAARQAADYFTQNGLAGGAGVAANGDSRRYYPPNASFSAPLSPSRESSIRSVSFDPRDLYTRGGLALNPPSEVGESWEDLSSLRDVHQRR